ncbi:MAG TPA: rhomboid family intramembrane serine protease [Candidatus Limnocylindria bacterium]|nr:rhomboid family intramembrane serine protease [Candidatus Limnocylindria bacterium]
MIPLSDMNPTRRLPLVNRVLLLVNIAAWLYVLTLPGAEVGALYDRYAFDPAALRVAIDAGRVDAGTLVPLVTHMFLHGGWLHLIGNMLYLWIFGDNVEDRLGSGRYLVFYLLAGLVAALVQAVIAPAAMVGASGAVAAVLGAYLVLFPGARVRTLVFLGIFITIVSLPAIVVIGLWVVVQVLSSLAGLRMDVHEAENVAYFAHVGGFFAGIGLLLVLRPQRRSLRVR